MRCVTCTHRPGWLLRETKYVDFFAVTIIIYLVKLLTLLARPLDEEERTMEPAPESNVEALPPTDMLYMTYEGNCLTECNSKVLSVHEHPADSKNGTVTVCLDRTVFHAQGGGQPTDHGQLLVSGEAAMDVIKVVRNRETGIARHTGNFLGASSLNVGQQVKASVDADLRRILSECHTGMYCRIRIPYSTHSPSQPMVPPLLRCVVLKAGHVVDSAMARCGKFLKPSKAYHFLAGPYVEYEGTVEQQDKESLLKDLQTAFCQLVDEQIDTRIELMSKEKADSVCNRLAQNFDVDIFADKITGQIRVVTVAGYPCPCGGTHVLSTADLKDRQWGITGLKSKKGVVRVKYGQNAV